MSTLAELPSIIRELREACGLTRDQLAARSGVSSSTIFEAERQTNAVPLSLRILEKIAVGLELEIDVRFVVPGTRPRTMARKRQPVEPAPLRMLR